MTQNYSFVDLSPMQTITLAMLSNGQMQASEILKVLNEKYNAQMKHWKDFLERAERNRYLMIERRGRGDVIVTITAKGLKEVKEVLAFYTKVKKDYMK
jgi:DNA-binding PadR family transcriptional regulator